MQPEIKILSPEESCARTHCNYVANLSAICVRAWYKGTSVSTIIRFDTHDPIDFIGALEVAGDNLSRLIKEIQYDDAKSMRKDDPDETKSMDAIKPPDHPEGDSESGQQDMEVLAALSRLEEMRKEKKDG